MHRCWLTLAVSAAILPLGAASSRAADVAVIDETLVVTGSAEVNDRIDVRPTIVGYEVYDARDELVAGVGCGNASPNLAYCGFLLVGVKVDGGLGDDVVGLWDVALPVELSGGAGDDFLEGGGAADSVAGGAGEDTLVGGAGNDLVMGEEGDDVLRGGDGADTIKGAEGDDVLEAQGGEGNVLLGGADRDLLRGGPSDDRLNGDSGDDVLLAGGGENVLETGPGQDEVFGVGRGDELRCTSQDRVRGTKPPDAPCGTLAQAVPRPTVWPPQVARSAQIPAPDPRVRAFIRRPGAAKRTTVCIEFPYFVADVLVKVRTYTRGRHLIKRFKRVMDASTCRSFRSPGPGKRAVLARARRRGTSF
jgi:hypothetical protein